jgi:hypothetical protein
MVDWWITSYEIKYSVRTDGKTPRSYFSKTSKEVKQSHETELVSTSIAPSLTSSSKLRSDERYLFSHMSYVMTEWGAASR